MYCICDIYVQELEEIVKKQQSTLVIFHSRERQKRDLLDIEYQLKIKQL